MTQRMMILVTGRGTLLMLLLLLLLLLAIVLLALLLVLLQCGVGLQLTGNLLFLDQSVLVI